MDVKLLVLILICINTCERCMKYSKIVKQKLRKYNLNQLYHDTNDVIKILYSSNKLCYYYLSNY